MGAGRAVARRGGRVRAEVPFEGGELGVWGVWLVVEASCWYRCLYLGIDTRPLVQFQKQKQYLVGAGRDLRACGLGLGVRFDQLGRTKDAPGKLLRIRGCCGKLHNIQLGGCV